MGQDVPTLLRQASCYDCYASTGMGELLKLGLLKDILLTLDPDAMTDPATLLKSASCYSCYGAQAQLLELALLDSIASNLDNTVSGQTGVFSGVADPVANPGVGSAVYYRTDNGKVWFWNDGLAYPVVLNPLGGSVGVGTTTPSSLFHVAGDVMATNLFLFAPTNGAAPPPGVKQPIGLFASMFYTVTNTIQMTNTSTFSVVTNFGEGYTNGFTMDMAKGFVTNVYAGFYRIDMFATFLASGNDTLEIELFLGEVGHYHISALHTYDNPARVDSLGSSGIHYIPANTPISMRVRNNSDTDPITVWRAILTVATP